MSETPAARCGFEGCTLNRSVVPHPPDAHFDTCPFQLSPYHHPFTPAPSAGGFAKPCDEPFCELNMGHEGAHASKDPAEVERA